MLLDEPFGALDAITRDQLPLWVYDMWLQHHWAMLLITHDIREGVRLSDQVFVLSPETDGGGSVSDHVSRPYSGAKHDLKCSSARQRLLPRGLPRIQRRVLKLMCFRPSPRQPSRRPSSGARGHE